MNFTTIYGDRHHKVTCRRLVFDHANNVRGQLSAMLRIRSQDKIIRFQRPLQMHRLPGPFGVLYDRQIYFPFTIFSDDLPFGNHQTGMEIL